MTYERQSGHDRVDNTTAASGVERSRTKWTTPAPRRVCGVAQMSDTGRRRVGSQLYRMTPLVAEQERG
jgi:hypothetical protein